MHRMIHFRHTTGYTAMIVVICLMGLSMGIAIGLPAAPAHAADWTVTNNSNADQGSLKSLIALAVFGDTINFNGDYTITLDSALTLNNCTVLGCVSNSGGAILSIGDMLTNEADYE